MATARKDQPWGVRTIYRNGRTILVGPYKGRRAAVLALQTANGRVRESQPVYLGPEVTGPLRVLREKTLGSGVPEDVGPVEGDFEVTQVVRSTGQGYQIEVQGVDLDLVNKFIIHIDGGGDIELDVDDDPGAFTSITDTQVDIFSEDFAGQLLEGITLADENGDPLGDSPFAYSAISFPRADLVTSPDANQLQIDGERLITAINAIEVITDQGTFIYYDPTGPNSGDNYGTATIDTWTDATILVTDTQWESVAPVTVSTINFLTVAAVTGYTDVNVVIVAPSNVTVDLVEGYGDDEPAVYIQGTDLDTVEVFRFAAQGAETEIIYTLPADVAKFVVLGGPSAVIKDTALRASRLTDLQVEDALNTPLAPSFDVDPDVGFADVVSALTPEREVLRVEGLILDSINRVEVNNGSYIFYDSAGPDAGSNSPGTTVTVTPTEVDIESPELANVEVESIEVYRADATASTATTPMDVLDGLSVTVLPVVTIDDVTPVGATESAAIMEITGTNLDTVETFEFTATGDETIISISRTGDPGAFYSDSDSAVQLQTALFHGSTITTLTLRDTIGDVLATLDFTDIPTAEITDVDSPAENTVEITGTLFDSMDSLVVTAGAFSQTYYDPSGPNNGLNPAGATILVWTATSIVVEDDEWTTSGPTYVADMTPQRLGAVSQYLYDVDPDVSVDPAITLTAAVQDEPSVDNGPATIVLTGQNLDQVVEVEFTTSIDETSIVLDTTNDPAAFLSQSATDITLESADFPGVLFEEVAVRSVLAGPDRATLDFTDFGVPEVESLTSPSGNRVRLEGRALHSVNWFVHFEEGIPNNNGWGVYDPNGPDAGSNEPEVTIIEWSDTVIEFEDTRFTDQSRLTIEHYLLARAGDNFTIWDGTADPVLAVQPAVSGPITDMQTIATDPHGLALIGTGLDLYDTVTVQACGNAFDFTYDLDVDAEVQSVTPTEIVIVDPAWAGNVIALAQPDAETPCDDAVVYGTIQSVDVWTLNTMRVIGERLSDDEVQSYADALGVTGDIPEEELVGGFRVDTVELGTVSYYRSDGPDAGLNPVGATVAWDDTASGWLIQDPQFTSAGPVEVTEITAFRGNGYDIFTANTTTIPGFFLEAENQLVGDEQALINEIGGSSGSYYINGRYLDMAAKVLLTTSAGPETEFVIELATLPAGVTLVNPLSINLGEAYKDWAGHTIASVDLLDGADVPITAQHTGDFLPLVIPAVGVTELLHQGANDSENPGTYVGYAQLEGDYLQDVTSVVLTTSGDEVTITIDPVSGAFYSGVSIQAEELLGCTVESVEVFEGMTSLGVFDVPDVEFPEVDSFSSPAADTVSIAGHLMGTVDSVYVQYKDTPETVFGSVTYYDPAGPNAGSNPPNVTFNSWTAALIEFEDADIQLNYPGVDLVDSFDMYDENNTHLYQVTSDFALQS